MSIRVTEQKNSWLLKQPIAHRGLHDNQKPENSLAAFQAAIDNNYAIELDIRLTADKEMVAFHDDDTQRLTGRPGLVSETDWTTLQNLKLLQTEQVIPSLAQVLALVRGRVPLVIELKNKTKDTSLEAKAWSILSQYSGSFAIQSFNPFSVGWFRQQAPSVLRGQLASRLTQEKISGFNRFLLSNLLLNKISQPDFIAYNIADLPRWSVNWQKGKGLPVLAWTIRSKQEAIKAQQYADNIFFENFRA